MSIDSETVRAAIGSLVHGAGTAADRACLVDFVAREVYFCLSPSKKRPGKLLVWLENHGYSRGALLESLFQGPVRNGMPATILGYAERITSAMIEGTCNCPERAHSAKAKAAATRRCRANHHLTHENLAAYAKTAEARVRSQYARRRQDPSKAELQKAVKWHSELLNFVRRATHGNSPLDPAGRKGGKDFGQSMLCAVYVTPTGTELRVKRRKNSYVLYDTRDGIEGEYRWRSIECGCCQMSFTETPSTPCGHPLLYREDIRNEPPPRTIELVLAECATGCSDGRQRTMWWWTDAQKRCPVCSGKRRKGKKVIRVAVEEVDEAYLGKQRDEAIPYCGSADFDSEEL